MEKITLNLEAAEIENTTFKFLGNKIEVVPTITIEDQVLFIRNYLDNYFDPSNDLISDTTTNYIGAEYALALEILDKYTNVDISEDKDVLLSLTDEIFSKISNYSDFREKLWRVVSDKKEELDLEKSVGTVIDGLVTKVTDFIERLASINIDDEGLAKLKSTAQELLTGIEQSPVAEVFKESSKQAQIDKVVETEAAKSTGRKRKSKKVE
jgi:hypothetical protein